MGVPQTRRPFLRTRKPGGEVLRSVPGLRAAAGWCVRDRAEPPGRCRRKAVLPESRTAGAPAPPGSLVRRNRPARASTPHDNTPLPQAPARPGRPRHGRGDRRRRSRRLGGGSAGRARRLPARFRLLPGVQRLSQARPQHPLRERCRRRPLSRPSVLQVRRERRPHAPLRHLGGALRAALRDRPPERRQAHTVGGRRPRRVVGARIRAAPTAAAGSPPTPPAPPTNASPSISPTFRRRLSSALQPHR